MGIVSEAGGRGRGLVTARPAGVSGEGGGQFEPRQYRPARGHGRHRVGQVVARNSVVERNRVKSSQHFGRSFLRLVFTDGANSHHFWNSVASRVSAPEILGLTAKLTGCETAQRLSSPVERLVGPHLPPDGTEHQPTASRNPTCQWEPSQKGLFLDAPHRHSV
jgi:hypothetical protein